MKEPHPFQIMGKGGLRDAKTTPAVDACIAYSVAYAELCARCTERPDDMTYHRCFDAAFGGSPACYEARRVRDPGALRVNCMASLDGMKCAEYRASGVPLACRGQIYFKNADDNAPSKLGELIPRPTASTTYPVRPGYTFYPANLVDDDLTTSWQPQRRDAEPWLRFEFPIPVTINAVGIANGFQAIDRDGDQFTRNRRIVSGRLRFSDDTEIRIDLDPSQRGVTRFAVPSKRTTSVTLLVDSQARGSKYQDLAVSEVAFELADAR